MVPDARTARNAGRIAVRNGKLTRMAQDNAHQYGCGLAMMEIERLSLQEFREKQVYAVTPGFVHGVGSTHHMDHLDEDIYSMAYASTARNEACVVSLCI